MNPSIATARAVAVVLFAVSLSPAPSHAAPPAPKPPPAAAASAEDASARAKKLLDRIDDLWRGNTSHATMAMQVKTKHYERTLRLEAWSKGKEKSLVRILAPRREKGTATLKDGKQIHTYLPRTARVIRLSSAMMGSAWMGSHFSNDDLVKESRMAEDYTFQIVAERRTEGRDTVQIQLTPKPDAAVVWGKVTLDIDMATELPIVQKYYDEQGKLARTMSFHDIKPMAGRKLPARMRITPADKPAEFTELRYEALELNVKLDDSFFSVSRLKRGR